MPNRILETVIKLHTDNFTIRVLRTVDSTNLDQDNTDLIDLVNSYSAMPNTRFNMYIVLSEIERLSNIVSIEILDSDGNGLILHQDLH